MTPLEYLLRFHARIYWRGSEVEFDFSADVPATKGDSLEEVVNAMAELMQEVKEHNPKSNKRKVSARVEGKKQIIIELAWNGRPLPSYHLETATERYVAGMRSPVNTFAGGAFSAAQRIGKHGGTVRIENFEDPVYTSRNVVALPINL